jgi:hypothetical protein
VTGQCFQTIIWQILVHYLRLVVIADNSQSMSIRSYIARSVMWKYGFIISTEMFQDYSLI